MTANELVEYIAEDLNTPSQESKTRISHALNVRYKQVTSSIGLNPTRREEISASAVVGNRNITFTGAEKLDIVFRKVGTNNVILREVTNDEMTELAPRSDPPTRFSIFSVAPQSIIIKLDSIPETTFTLYAYVLADATTLTNNDQPAFPESFHDILIHGVKADEYRRREKANLAKESEMLFQQRLSDLRMFIAKSAYLDIYRSKHHKGDGWWDYEINKY